MKITSSTKILIVLILIALVLLAGGYFLFSLIRSKNQEISKLANELVFYQNKKQEVIQNEKKGEHISTFEKQIDSYFVGKEGVVPFIETLETEAKNHALNIKIKDVNVQQHNDDNPDPNREVMVLQLETEGSWQNLMYFLAYIEHLPYIVSMSSVTVDAFTTQDEKEKTTNGWKGNVAFSVIKQK